MITANYYNLDGNQVGDKLTFGTSDLEFAKLQAIAVTGMKVSNETDSFVVLCDGDKRMVISNDIS